MRVAKEGCRSGRTGCSRKALNEQSFRGFESLPFRHTSLSMTYDFCRSELHLKVTPFSLMFINVSGVY